MPDDRRPGDQPLSRSDRVAPSVATATTSLLLVDDHPIVLAGLRLLLDAYRGYRIVGEAASAAEACELATIATPDFIIADIVLGGRDGPELVEDLLAISPRSQVLSYSSLDDAHAAGVLRAGARGYVCKADGLQRVADALDCMARGGIWASDRILQQLAGVPTGDAASMSARERQVFELIGQDVPLQDIARQMALSVKTVGTYRERLKVKLGLDTVRALERHARDQVARREAVR